jgi:ergothioneine biosynthesis protein EgtC
MCRLLAYQGPPLTVDDLLYRPDHSLIKQSYNAREIKEPLNGDGFGLGWYVPELTPDPAVFASVSPAWNNRNLRYMAPKLVSPTIFAHVRAASCGHANELNCHPFHYGDLLMMHNGGVAHFERIKRALSGRLSDPRYAWVDGQTDSQHLFALFLDHYFSTDARGAAAMADALTAMFRDLEALKQEAGLTEPAHLNMVVTNGREMAGSRYVDIPGERALSLHHTEGSRYVCDGERCAMRAAEAHEQAVIIASEPLTDEAHHWHDVPQNHFVLVDEQARPVFREIVV